MIKTAFVILSIGAGIAAFVWVVVSINAADERYRAKEILKGEAFAEKCMAQVGISGCAGLCDALDGYKETGCKNRLLRAVEAAQ